MFGVTIRTSEIAQPFWQLVDRVSAFESEPSIRNLNYPPHLTLARYETIDPALLTAGLDIFKGMHRITLVFDRVCIFENGPLVLWLSSYPDPELLEIQARLHRLIDEELSDPHYRPAAWRPHCTIASSVLSEHRAAAMAFAGKPIEPFALTFDAADALEWLPVRQIGSRHLL